MLVTVRALIAALISAVGVAAAVVAPAPAPAAASGRPVAMFEEDVHLLADPARTLATLRQLGAGVVRLSVAWNSIAPAAFSANPPRGFNASDPAAYPAGSWAPYDAVVREAQAFGITLDLSLTGPPPRWATGPGKPRHGGYPAWEPSASQYGKFVQAIGTRYSGQYQGLPRVRWWELWNEPNFGPDLTPQAIKGSTISVAPMVYRGLVDAAWQALRASGHASDTIILGNLDARGQSGRPSRYAPDGLPGNFGATKPMQFIRTLYCVDASYRQLRGRAAAVVGCPPSPAGSRRFRAVHPGLFQAPGFADHPYPVNLPPTQASSTDPDFVEFNELPRFAAALDRLQRIYGSGHRFAIYNNEYGYITNPPNRSAVSRFVSPPTAAYYINWAEYLTWRNPRIASTMQFLLYDPNPFKAPEYGGFASGLLFYGGKPKASVDAYRLPVFLPVTTARRGHSLELWGDARPAHFYDDYTVQVQFQRGSRGRFRTIRTVRAGNPLGYFDTRIVFPASGSVRLAWSYPAGPAAGTPGSGAGSSTGANAGSSTGGNAGSSTGGNAGSSTGGNPGSSTGGTGSPVTSYIKPPPPPYTVYSRTTNVTVR